MDVAETESLASAPGSQFATITTQSPPSFRTTRPRGACMFCLRQIGRPLYKFLFVLFAIAVIPLAMACGGDDDDSGSTSGAKVDATLKDYQISLSESSVASGDVTFKIKNNGPSQHEFLVDRTDLAADALPYDDAGAKVKEDSPDLTNVGSKKEIDKGDSTSLTVNLPPGHYVLFCNIPAHYKQGMHVDFTVK